MIVFPDQLCYSLFYLDQTITKSRKDWNNFYLKKVKGIFRHKKVNLNKRLFPRCSVAIYASTYNHYQTFAHLENEINSEKISFIKEDNNFKFSWYFKEKYFSKGTLIKNYLLLFLFEVFYLCFSQNKRKILQNNRQKILNAYLAYHLFKIELTSTTIKSIVIFNDHSAKHRALRLAAQKNNIATIYIPHASVSEKFPPLAFDYALLEGQDMLMKYQKAGNIKSKVKILGNVKLDNFRKQQLYTQKIEKFIPKNVGVAFNPLDNLESVKELAAELNHQFNLIIRPHPGLLNKINLEENFGNYSISKNETSLRFFNRLDFLVSGDSNIILEALLCNIPVLRCKFEKRGNFSDNYGFINNKLVPVASEATEVNDKLAYLKISHEVIAKLSFWDASINNDYPGQSNDKLIEFLEGFCQN